MNLQLQVAHVDMGGAIIHFSDGKRGLVRAKEQDVTREWLQGDRLEVSIADSPVFRLRSLDTEEVAHVLLYQGDEQLLTLPF